MASWITKPPAGQPQKGSASEQPKRGIKNPVIYAGTVVLLVIVVVAFVFVPAGGGALGSTRNSLEFGSYAGKSIAYTQGSYFAEQVKELNDNLRQSGLPAENYQFYAYQIWHGAYDRAVVRVAILDAMDKAQAAITDERIDERITQLPNYMESGRFSLKKYNSAPLNERLALRKSLREDMLVQRYYEDVVQSRAPSSKETAFVKAMANDTRTIEYVAFPLSSIPDPEVAAWAAANADSLKRLTLSRITLGEKEDEALKLRQAVLDKSKTFEDSARTSSKDGYAEKGGAMGPKFLYEIQGDLAKKEDAEKLVSLAAGELSPVMKTAAGSYAFYRADAAPAAADLADKAILAAARKRMLDIDSGKVEDYVSGVAKKFVESSAKADFAKAAKAADLAVKTAGPFPINYGDLSLYVQEYRQSIPLFKEISGEGTPELAQASASERFLIEAFSVAPGSLSEPMVLGENVIVFRVKESAAAAEDSGGIEVFFPYFVRTKAEGEARDAFMKSPDFKDNFSAVYLKTFVAKDK